CQQVSNWPLTF
nr:immunoglobulin light chain junction region [Macaca mulatta]